ncbi:DUF3396 domain-containing protein [Archangium minus]|uniref:DUF3396 domain-containing protein n=1 Tax=Archangium minus TaxID=83450 RepID=A0ABY9WGZ2_9BACT|nr:DUF3396 domain-containing protein [Archangium minus]
MTPHYPRLRLRGIPPGRWKSHEGKPPRPRRELLARDVFRLAFYLPHDHSEIAEGVLHAVNSYIQAVGEGPKAINRVYLGGNDEGAPLTEEWWGYIRNTLQPQRRWYFPDDYSEAEARRVEKRGYQTRLILTGGISGSNGYQLEYRARLPYRPPTPNAVSLLTATLPTEYLEAHGAMRVRALALEMASRLRFASGHAGLALSLYSSLRISSASLRTELFRYPGIDVRPAWLDSHQMGLQIDGVHWLNFLAQPVLGELGGAAVLSSRLHAPETTVQELGEDRVVISLGDCPNAGDLSVGQELPAYRELARFLDPWLEPLRLSHGTLFVEPPRYTALRFTEEEARRWWRRFLD